MAVIDFILNLAGLLLWLNWRSARLDLAPVSRPASLAGILKRAEPRRLTPWHFLLALPFLLFLRALLYWQIGPAVDWVPSLKLGSVAFYFRSDLLPRALLFSLLSFIIVWAIFHLWLLLLSLINSGSVEAEPLQKFVRFHLGRLDRLPWPIKIVLPWFLACLLWLALIPLLARWEIIPLPVSTIHRLEQAGTLGLSVYLSWKYLLGCFLGLYVLSSYIFLGNHLFWNFVAVTSRNFLGPLRKLPLRLGKLDLAPLLGVALVFLAAEFAERGLTALYTRLPL